MMSFTEVSIDTANMKSKHAICFKKSQKKTLHHGGQKDRDGVYGKEKQGVYLLHITTRTALRLLQTTYYTSATTRDSLSRHGLSCLMLARPSG
ncbi:hypothetical protein PEC730217_24530 [Pectobacterium carotovorum subsp. carotovorum]|nr:hypothetical protein PEC730217_24530 [Pectobacterium carotovorum subsp. carotovorum]